MTSLIKSDGSILPFFSRPVAAVLATMAIAALLWPAAFWLVGLMRPGGVRPSGSVDQRR